MKIVVPARILRDKVPSNILSQKLRAMGAEVYEDVPTVEEIKRRIADAEIVTTRISIGMTADMIDAAPNLKYIIVPAVGVDVVDIEHATKKGVRVLNCPTHNSQTVAEYAIALLLVSARQLIPANAKLRHGEWDDEAFTGIEVEGKSMGLIGYGNVGKRIEKLAKGLGMSVSYVNSKSSADDLDALLKNSDFVCVCAPLNDSTYHLLNKERLNTMKPEAVLINVGRGAVIDQSALLETLKSNKIKAAALDVFEGESQEPLNPQIIELANLPNVVAMPHMAYNTNESVGRLQLEIIADINLCLDGHPINVVN